MKKCFLLLAVFMIVSGVVWAQDRVSEIPDFFTAVPTISTEARFSAWQFDSDVDNFIDPRFYDPEIGTFLFMGGFPSGGNVYATNNLYDASDYAISLGFARTLGSNYLGVYYGGSFVRADGEKDGPFGNDDDFIRNTSATWNNNLAVLLGMPGMGIRFDLVMDNVGSTTELIRDSNGNDYRQYDRTGGPGISFTWGSDMGDLFPFVKLGFKFADEYWSINDDGDRYSMTYGGFWGLQGGAYYDIDEFSGFSAALLVGGQFKETFREPDEDHVKEGGMFGLALNADYMRSMQFGKFTLQFNPSLYLDFSSYNDTPSYIDDSFPRDNIFSLGFDLYLGARYQHEKIALYSGFGLNLFNWDTSFYTGGDDDYKDGSNSWEISGISWINDTLGPGGILAFGMTFTPVEGLVFGVGLSNLLQNVFTLNLQRMQLSAGNIINSSGVFTNIFNSGILDLTVSYRF